MDLRTATARPTLAAAEVAALRAAGVLIEDPRRERPRYFDGRFLAARDLIRDQQYILAREADLGRAACISGTPSCGPSPGMHRHALRCRDLAAPFALRRAPSSSGAAGP